MSQRVFEYIRLRCRNAPLYPYPDYLVFDIIILSVLSDILTVQEAVTILCEFFVHKGR